MNNYTAIAAPGMFSELNNGKNFNVSLSVFEQKDTKPAIDDVICQYLDGSTLKNALNFIDYVRASKMKIKWTAVNVWSVRYKNKRVLDIVVKQDSWRVRLAYDHIASNAMFTLSDKENIKNLIGQLRSSAPESLEPTPALS